MKSIRINVVKDPSDFPYYQIAAGHTRLNFTKITDVCEFVSRYMAMDTDKPIITAQKEVIEERVVRPGKPRSQVKSTIIQDFLGLSDCDKGVTYDEATYVLGCSKFQANQAALFLEKNNKVFRLNPEGRPIRWKKVRSNELPR